MPQDAFPETEWGVSGGKKTGTPMYVTHVVEPAAYCKVVQWARTHSASVEDVVLAAYYRALRDSLKVGLQSKAPVQLWCDLRSLLPDGARLALANLSASRPVTVEYDEGEPFAETLRDIAETSAEWKRSGAANSLAMGLLLADRLNRGKGVDAVRKQVETSIAKLGHGWGYPQLVNAGCIDEERVNFGDAHARGAWVLGQIALPPGFALTASVFRDRLHLCAGIDRAATDIKLATAIVEGTARELEAAVA